MIIIGIILFLYGIVRLVYLFLKYVFKKDKGYIDHCKRIDNLFKEKTLN